MKISKQGAMVKKYIFLLIVLFALGLNIKNLAGQENITMYNMRTLPQTSKLNPAFETGYNGHFGGLITTITPIFGQIAPNLDFNFHSSSFAYEDVIYKGTGIYADSLVTAFVTDEDARAFADKLDKVNTIGFDMNLNIFNVGFRTKSLYWSVHAINKTSFKFGFPGDLVQLAVKGNVAPDISSNLDLSGLGVDFINYMEYGVGVSKEIIPDLNIGIRAKALAGIANLETVKSDLSLISDESITIRSDIHMRASQPALVLDDFYYDREGDSLVSETTEQETDQIISDLGYDFGNPGVAFDIGAEYKIMPEVTAYASITDIGFINWKTNVAEIKGGGDFVFRGLDAVEYIGNNDDDTTTIGDTYQDSIINMFDIRKTDVSSYNSWLPTKIYAGANYNLTDAISFGGLYRGIIYDGQLKSAVSISANANTNAISATITYTMMEDNFDNIGVGFAGRVGPFQIYLLSDHVLEEIFPQTARDINIRMGVNWIFGYKKDKAALIE